MKESQRIDHEVQKAGLKAAVDLLELSFKTGKKSLRKSAAKVTGAVAKGDTKEIFDSVIKAE